MLNLKYIGTVNLQFFSAHMESVQDFLKLDGRRNNTLPILT